MIAETTLEAKAPPAAPDLSKFADRDFTEGVEIDEDQEWIGELLAERVRRLDAGLEKTYTVEEVWQWLEAYKQESRRKNS